MHIEHIKHIKHISSLSSRPSKGRYDRIFVMLGWRQKKFELNHDMSDHYQLCNHFMIVLMQEWILKLELNHN